jgi:hypothetical protein
VRCNTSGSPRHASAQLVHVAAQAKHPSTHRNKIGIKADGPRMPSMISLTVPSAPFLACIEFRPRARDTASRPSSRLAESTTLPAAAAAPSRGRSTPASARTRASQLSAHCRRSSRREGEPGLSPQRHNGRCCVYVGRTLMGRMGRAATRCEDVRGAELCGVRSHHWLQGRHRRLEARRERRQEAGPADDNVEDQGRRVV